MEELRQILASLEPAEALNVLLPRVRELLALLDEQARLAFVEGLLGGPEGDKVSSMVQL